MTFRALVVDDDPWVRDKAIQASDPRTGLVVLVAANKTEAADIIAGNFLHVAIVNLELSVTSRERAEGLQILRALRQSRPSCRRILLTKYAARWPERLFDLLRPDSRILDGAIDKEDLGDYFDHYLAKMAEEWHRGTVEVTNLDAVYDLLKTKRVAGIPLLGAPVPATEDELRYVLAGLFGQRFRGEKDEPNADEVKAVHLEPLLGGKSRSIVLQGRPVDHLGGEGLLCVVKVGPRPDAEQELTRYEQYVRFRVALHRRVEVLGHMFGDTVGAIAYTFAGRDPGVVIDLQTLLDRCDEVAFERMTDLYAGAGDWATESDHGGDLGAFFAQAYNLKLRKVNEKIDKFADSQAAAKKWQHRPGALILDGAGGKLTLPTDDDLGAGLLHMDYRTTIVHGDLNGSNVIIDDAGSSILIDYRHTTRGPRALDYASMHASIRLSPDALNEGTMSLAESEKTEYRLWREWKAPDVWWSERAGPAPYWLQAAGMLMRITGEHLPDLRRAEYVATCWLYAMRVFRVSQLDEASHLRILVWLSALQRVLAEEAEPGL